MACHAYVLLGICTLSCTRQVLLFYRRQDCQHGDFSNSHLGGIVVTTPPPPFTPRPLIPRGGGYLFIIEPLFMATYLSRTSVACGVAQHTSLCQRKCGKM